MVDTSIWEPIYASAFKGYIRSLPCFTGSIRKLWCPFACCPGDTVSRRHFCNHRQPRMFRWKWRHSVPRVRIHRFSRRSDVKRFVCSNGSLSIGRCIYLHEDDVILSSGHQSALKTCHQNTGGAKNGRHLLGVCPLPWKSLGRLVSNWRTLSSFWWIMTLQNLVLISNRAGDN